MMKIAMVAAAGIASTAGAQVVWDYGLDAAVADGGMYAGCWWSQDSFQNFTDNATFELATQIYGMTYDSCVSDLLNMSFQIKVESDTDGDGVPDAPVTVIGASPVSQTFLGIFDDAEVYRYAFEFGPIVQPGGAVWYWGVSGDDFDAGQVSHAGSGLPLANGHMHQYEGDEYGAENPIGDQAFQLIGVPAPGAGAMMAVAGVLAARRRR